MKHLTVRDIAKELDLEENVIYQNLLEVIEEEKQADTDTKFILDEENRQVYVFEMGDIRYINRAEANELSFIELAKHFNVATASMNLLLENLTQQGSVNPRVLKYLREVKNKPLIKVRYEPEAVSLGEDAFMVVEVDTEVAIGEPSITLDVPEDLDVPYSPTLPKNLSPGRLVYRYQFKALRYGKYKVGASFHGVIMENIYQEPLQVPELWVKSLPPKLHADKVPRGQDVYAEYNQNLDLVFRVTNRGTGEALSVKMTGFGEDGVRVITGEEIGRIAVKARIDHPVTIRPEKSGSTQLEQLKIHYKDGDGNDYVFEMPPLNLNVTTTQPELRIDFDVRRFVNANEIFSAALSVTNIGKGPAHNLHLRTRIEPSYSALNVPFEHTSRLLRPGEQTQVNFELRAPESGEVRLEVYDINFADVEGNRLEEKAAPVTIKVREFVGATVGKQDWPFELGAQIGKYQINESLGEGGFAHVYHVRDTIMRAERALKALKPEYVDDKVMVEEFISEARNAQGLRSPNIVQVFDVSGFEFKGKSYPYIIMEAVLGGTLREKMVPGEPMDLIESCYVARDICDALLVAHREGMIHQDIKPSNIFFDDRMVLWKLGDFGLAEITRGKAILSSEGTASYMAPEPKKSHKSDIYSLGLVMREMITGTRRGNIQRLRRSSELRDARTEKLIDIVERMTDSTPEKRPELREVIEVLDLSTVQR